MLTVICKAATREEDLNDSWTVRKTMDAFCSSLQNGLRRVFSHVKEDSDHREQNEFTSKGRMERRSEHCISLYEKKKKIPMSHFGLAGPGKMMGGAASTL